MSDDNRKPQSVNPKAESVKPKRKHVKTGRPRGFDRQFKVITKDIVRKAYMTWDWETQEDLAAMLLDRYGETVSVQYISRHSIKDGWEDIRKLVLAGSGPRYLPSVQPLAREASHFDPMEHLKGFQSRLVKRLAAEVPTNPDPEFFKGFMEVYHSVQKAIADTWEYKLRDHNRPTNEEPAAGKPTPKPEVQENVPASVSAQIAPFKRRP